MRTVVSTYILLEWWGGEGTNFANPTPRDIIEPEILFTTPACAWVWILRVCVCAGCVNVLTVQGTPICIYIYTRLLYVTYCNGGGGGIEFVLIFACFAQWSRNSRKRCVADYRKYMLWCVPICVCMCAWEGRYWNYTHARAWRKSFATDCY